MQISASHLPASAGDIAAWRKLDDVCKLRGLTPIEACLAAKLEEDACVQLRRAACRRMSPRKPLWLRTWTRHNHWVQHTPLRVRVVTVLNVGMCGPDHLPRMPPEMWQHICTFFLRAWWPPSRSGLKERDMTTYEV